MFSVSFTSMTVTETLMLTSIDRPEGVFTQESIIKVAQLGTDSYFAPPPPPPSPGESRVEGRLGLGRGSMESGYQRCFTHSENSVLSVCFITIIESDC